MNVIHTDTLILEPQVAAHAAEMFEVLADPAIYEFENAPPQSAVWLRHRFEKLESRMSPDGEEQWLNWVVRLPTGVLAGYVQATVRRDGSAHVAYVLASRFWRQGIGGAAVKAVLEELVAAYGAKTFVATLKARNYRSVALLRSLGFIEGVRLALVAKKEPDEIVMSKELARTERGVISAPVPINQRS